MRTGLRRFVLAIFLLASFLSSSAMRAGDQFGSRQFFGDWHNHAAGFSYRPYYYKPTPDFVGFKHHYVVHYQTRPQFNYFYNPYTKQFWGRCPVAAEGKA